MRVKRVAAMVLLGLAVGGCEVGKKKEPGEDIQVGASYAVRFATNRVSAAVVRLDVVTEDFVEGQPRSSRSIGSGVIIDKEGHVLTNFHVAGRAKQIDITLGNQEHVKAKLVGSDHWTDLALVQLDMEEMLRRKMSFSFAKLGESANTELGQPVMAVGTPYGLSRTLTAGIVSNTDRFFDQTTIEGYETGWFNNWIQTDAAINPGNSGGPLINLRGEVVGINTRGVSEGNNLGFAIPIDVAKEVAGEILKHGKVSRSYTGLELQPLQDLEKYYNLAADRGVLISSVQKESPAAVAGVKAEDILLAVDGKRVNVRFPEQLAAVRKLMSDYPIGSTMLLTVQRNGVKDPVTVSVKTEKLESAVTEQKSIAEWGLSVRDLTRTFLREARLPYMQGVLVTGAKPGSPADTASIQAGDIILRVDDKAVTSTEELEAAVAAWKKNPRPVGIDVRRDRGTITRVLKPRG